MNRETIAPVATPVLLLTLLCLPFGYKKPPPPAGRAGKVVFDSLTEIVQPIQRLASKARIERAPVDQAQLQQFFTKVDVASGMLAHLRSAAAHSKQTKSI